MPEDTVESPEYSSDGVMKLLPIHEDARRSKALSFG
jgi:hypothetical protein